MTSKQQKSLDNKQSIYKDHCFKFVSISKDAEALRGKSYKNPHALKFAPRADIHDVQSLLNIILHLDISKQYLVYEFLKKELPPAQDHLIAETNIAAVINILAKEDLNHTGEHTVPIPFDVDKKLTFNNLDTAAAIIEDHKIHHHRIERIYADFDLLGKNKSASVLQSLRSSYIRLSSQYSSDDLFFQVVDHAIKMVQESANHSHMPLEELELCVNILAVDAFIRCRIFKNPKEETHVAA